MPWVSMKFLEALVQDKARAERENRRLVNLLLRIQGPREKQAVDDEHLAQVTASRESAGNDAIRAGIKEFERIRRNGPEPSDADFEYDETAEIGGPL